MNVRDTEVVCGLLKRQGYKITEEAGEADIIIFNTCSVRQHAEDKVWSEIGKYAKLRTPYSVRRTHNQRPIIGLIGCMAQNYKEQIFQRAPSVDFVVGSSDIHKIPSILKRLAIDHRPSTIDPLFQVKIWETDGSKRPEEIYHTGYYQDKDHAYVVISEGCSNYCSYCLVPYVRGDLHNRDYKEILKEIEEAIDNGINKFTLLGQNVNAYQSTVSFVQLLKLVNGIKGLEEFSFITSHPKDTSVELFQAMQDLEKLKKYLHLPVQSGSDKILKLMNRGYSRRFYLDLVQNYRKIVKEGLLTTDIIVGFPTETDKDFQETYDLVKGAGFNAAYIFKYSVRPHTAAENMPDDVAKVDKERRHKEILGLQKEISRKKR